MNSLLLFDFSVDKEKKTITVKKEFAADVPTVWNAFTTKEILDQWWAPKPWKAKTKSMDFREGGAWLYAMMGPNGEEHWATCSYNKIIKNKYYAGIDGFSDSNGVLNSELPRMRWEVSFSGKKDTTLVEVLVTFDELSQLEAILTMGFKEGFTIALEGLDELLPLLKK